MITANFNYQRPNAQNKGEWELIVWSFNFIEVEFLDVTSGSKGTPAALKDSTTEGTTGQDTTVDTTVETTKGGEDTTSGGEDTTSGGDDTTETAAVTDP